MFDRTDPDAWSDPSGPWPAVTACLATPFPFYRPRGDGPDRSPRGISEQRGIDGTGQPRRTGVSAAEELRPFGILNHRAGEPLLLQGSTS